MTFIPEDILSLPEVTTIKESDKFYLSRGGSKVNVDKFQFTPLCEALFSTISPTTSTLATTFSANNTPTPLLNNLWQSVSGNAIYNFTQTTTSNRKYITVDVPASASVTEQIRFIANGHMTFKKSGGSASTFSLRIARNGTVFSTSNSAFTLNDDTQYLSVPVSGIINADDGDQIELYVERILGDGNLIMTGGEVFITGMKMRNG
jgi:hypothetical protein